MLPSSALPATAPVPPSAPHLSVRLNFGDRLSSFAIMAGEFVFVSVTVLALLGATAYALAGTLNPSADVQLAIAAVMALPGLWCARRLLRLIVEAERELDRHTG